MQLTSSHLPRKLEHSSKHIYNLAMALTLLKLPTHRSHTRLLSLPIKLYNWRSKQQQTKTNTTGKVLKQTN
ncbi:hypothetical protein [Caudoviricetes sp.]|nr:hypothetical protein [Caudoviricetes sp.]